PPELPHFPTRRSSDLPSCKRNFESVLVSELRQRSPAWREEVVAFLAQFGRTATLTIKYLRAQHRQRNYMYPVWTLISHPCWHNYHHSCRWTLDFRSHPVQRICSFFNSMSAKLHFDCYPRAI